MIADSSSDSSISEDDDVKTIQSNKDFNNSFFSNQRSFKAQSSNPFRNSYDIDEFEPGPRPEHGPESDLRLEHYEDQSHKNVDHFSSSDDDSLNDISNEVTKDDASLAQVNQVTMDSDNNFNSDQFTLKYVDLYKLSAKQYELLDEFFKECSENDLLSVNLLETLTNKQLESRSIVKASKHDVKKALKLIDTNNDNLINFNELIDFLSLFFANESNLAERIESVLNSKSYTQLKPYFLSKDEANYYFDFLRIFFTNIDDPFDFDLNTAAFNKPTFDERVSNKKFSQIAASYLKNSVYIKWHN
jgi:hypothetical protein